ncbi:outer membrane homotrimeric porin [Desulfonatronum thioautotrophicum]|uniref:outer membrane homotrimeric porin n=1 Tax=Desulfonatronum thioautotrophicum TaxID=617001 RepID=UPI0005EB2B1D|nr:outer membrane homotrimeric porin [Desulfonatronum thioautotrophicum]
MKRVLAVIFLAALMLGHASIAAAVELKVSGQWRFHINYVENFERAFNESTGKWEDSEKDTFLGMHRARVAFEFVASENLRGVIQLQAGNIKWGLGGGEINNANSSVTARQLYLNFKVPNTDAAVMVGKLPFSLPSTYGTHILAGNHSALATSIPFNDMVGLTAGWARAYDRTQGTFDTKIDDEVDVFFAVLPIKMDGVRLNPFSVYARWGKDFLNDIFGDGVEPNPFKNADQWFAGLNVTVNLLDPIELRGNVNYGTVDFTDNFSGSGWIFDISTQYQGLDLFTPELFFLYETGEDSSYSRGGDSKRLPTINTDGDSWIGSSYGLSGSRFGSADSIFRNFISSLPGASLLDDYYAQQGALGMWALGFRLGGMQFIDKLTHDLTFMYAQGTNDSANTQLFTKDDKYFEVNFDHNYKIYDNLTARLELGWGKLDLDRLNTLDRDEWSRDNAWKAVIGFLYNF